MVSFASMPVKRIYYRTTTLCPPCSRLFMDGWTFDTERLSKCSCQHLLPGNRWVPSCGYYAYHRQYDARFA